MNNILNTLKYQRGTPDGTFATPVEFVSYILLIGNLEKSFVKGETVSKNLEDDWTKILMITIIQTGLIIFLRTFEPGSNSLRVH